MPQEKRMLVDVGMHDLPFPMHVASRDNPDGQPTVANVSVRARITHEFEANWIDKFIRVLHQHQEKVGTKNLRANILEYVKELRATSVTIDYSYPFFVEKQTPVSKDRCLVRYMCTYTAKVSSIMDKPKIMFKIEIPAITTDPASVPDVAGGLFGQLSVVTVEVDSTADVYPEDLVDLVDRCALSPVYSFLSREDQMHIINKVHTEKKSSVVLTDEIKMQLAKDDYVHWFAVRTSNHGMLHSYSTLVATEKGMWVPDTDMDDDSL